MISRTQPIKEPSNLRIFFAIWPNNVIQHQLHTIAKQQQLQCQGRVMRAETLHMTLQFIGNIQRCLLPKVIAAADRITALPFSMQLTKIAHWEHNRIVYASLNSKVDSLENLASDLRIALHEKGITTTDQKFNPHVTLMRNAEHKPKIQEFPLIEWRVNSFVLVESMLSEQGAHYRIIKEWKL